LDNEHCFRKLTEFVPANGNHCNNPDNMYLGYRPPEDKYKPINTYRELIDDK